MEPCSVCMESMDESNSRTLECTHTFHKECLERWKLRMSTCPMCRAPFDKPMYNIKLIIDPIGYEDNLTTSNIQGLIDSFGLDDYAISRFMTSVSFSVMNIDDMRNILEEIGFGSFSSASSNLSSLYTESRTEF